MERKTAFPEGRRLRRGGQSPIPVKANGVVSGIILGLWTVFLHLIFCSCCAVWVAPQVSADVQWHPAALRVFFVFLTVFEMQIASSTSRNIIMLLLKIKTLTMTRWCSVTESCGASATSLFLNKIKQMVLADPHMTNYHVSLAWERLSRRNLSPDGRVARHLEGLQAVNHDECCFFSNSDSLTFDQVVGLGGRALLHWHGSHKTTPCMAVYTQASFHGHALLEDSEKASMVSGQRSLGHLEDLVALLSVDLSTMASVSKHSGSRCSALPLARLATTVRLFF